MCRFRGFAKHGHSAVSTGLRHRWRFWARHRRAPSLAGVRSQLGDAMKRTSSLCAIAAVLLALQASAQVNSSRIEGIVSDSQSLPLPGANVVLTETRTGLTRSAETSSAGTYLFPSLGPGQYELRVEAKGFSTEVLRVTLEVDQAL